MWPDVHETSGRDIRKLIHKQVGCALTGQLHGVCVAVFNGRMVGGGEKSFQELLYQGCLAHTPSTQDNELALFHASGIELFF